MRVEDRRAAREVDAVAWQHRPALDGLRAVAVVLVLCFHAGMEWMPAGYLGVSVFFTLSGYLITSLLLVEDARSGAIAIGGFYARRVRRLAPASLLCLLAVAVARAEGQWALVPNLRDQLIGAATHVYNWVRLAGDTSYADAFRATPALVSPLEHYWSLAVEEQTYLVWPFLLGAIACWARRRGQRTVRVARRVLVALVLAATAAGPLVARTVGPDAAYWATPVRMGEVLVGGLLATILLGRVVPDRLGRLALPALVVVVAASALLPRSGGPAYGGWLTPCATVSAVLIAALHGPSLLRRALETRLVVGLGRISYAVYLFHWPVAVWLRQHGHDTAAPGWFLALLVSSVGLASVSYPFERWVRAARWGTAPSLGLAAAAMVCVAVVAVQLPLPRGFLEADDASLSAASATAGGAVDTGVALAVAAPGGDGASTATTRATVVPPTTVPTAPQTTVPRTTVPSTTVVPRTAPLPLVLAPELPPAATRPVRVLTVGDSTAFYVGQALSQWAVDHPDRMTSDVLWCQGCGFILDGTITSWDASAYLAQSNEVVLEQLPDRVAVVHPDVVVLMVTIDDVTDRVWTQDEGVLTPFDAAYRSRMLDAYTAVTRQLVELGVPSVVWIEPPVPHWMGKEDELREVGRWQVMDQVIETAAAAVGPAVHVLDLDGWLTAAGHADDGAWRADGVHLDETSAYAVVDEWLAPEVLGIALGTTG